MPVITAIELLLECGDLKAADDLYQSRLENGSVFRWIPAPHWGMEVARWFVRDEERRQRLEAQLGARRLSFYLNDVGLFADYAGEPETALPHYAAAEALDRQAGDSIDLSIGLQNLADVETSLGRLGDAVRHATEALELAVQAKDDRQDAQQPRLPGIRRQPAWRHGHRRQGIRRGQRHRKPHRPDGSTSSASAASNGPNTSSAPARPAVPAS